MRFKPRFLQRRDSAPAETPSPRRDHYDLLMLLNAIVGVFCGLLGVVIALATYIGSNHEQKAMAERLERALTSMAALASASEKQIASLNGQLEEARRQTSVLGQQSSSQAVSASAALAMSALQQELALKAGKPPFRLDIIADDNLKGVTALFQNLGNEAAVVEHMSVSYGLLPLDPGQTDKLEHPNTINLLTANPGEDFRAANMPASATVEYCASVSKTAIPSMGDIKIYCEFDESIKNRTIEISAENRLGGEPFVTNRRVYLAISVEYRYQNGKSWILERCIIPEFNGLPFDPRSKFTELYTLDKLGDWSTLNRTKICGFR